MKFEEYIYYFGEVTKYCLAAWDHGGPDTFPEWLTYALGWWN